MVLSDPFLVFIDFIGILLNSKDKINQKGKDMFTTKYCLNNPNIRLLVKQQKHKQAIKKLRVSVFDLSCC